LSSSPGSDLLAERHLREAAEARSSLDPPLKEDFDELEVELVEAREGKGRQGPRAPLLQDIMERTKRVIADGRRAVIVPPVKG
jgi:hypothetical protein